MLSIKASRTSGVLLEVDGQEKREKLGDDARSLYGNAARVKLKQIVGMLNYLSTIYLIFDI